MSGGDIQARPISVHLPVPPEGSGASELPGQPLRVPAHPAELGANLGAQCPEGGPAADASVGGEAGADLDTDLDTPSVEDDPVDDRSGSRPPPSPQPGRTDAFSASPGVDAAAWYSSKKVIWSGVAGVAVLGAAVLLLTRKPARTEAQHEAAAVQHAALAARPAQSPQEDELGLNQPVATSETEKLGQGAGASTEDPAAPGPTGSGKVAEAAAASVQAEKKLADATGELVASLGAKMDALQAEIAQLQVKLREAQGSSAQAAAGAASAAQTAEASAQAEKHAAGEMGDLVAKLSAKIDSLQTEISGLKGKLGKEQGSSANAVLGTVAVAAGVEAGSKVADAMSDVQKTAAELADVKAQLAAINAKLDDPQGAKAKAAEDAAKLKANEEHVDKHGPSDKPMPEEDWIQLLQTKMIDAGVSKRISISLWNKLPQTVRLNFLDAMGGKTSAEEKKILVDQIIGTDVSAKAGDWKEPLNGNHYKALLEAALVYGTLYKHLPERAQHLGLPGLESVAGVKIPLELARHSRLMKRMREVYLAKEQLVGWEKLDDEQRLERQLEAVGKAAAVAYAEGIKLRIQLRFNHRVNHLGTVRSGNRSKFVESGQIPAWIDRLNPIERNKVERSVLDHEAAVHKIATKFLGDDDANRAANTERAQRGVGRKVYKWLGCVGSSQIGAGVVVGGLGVLAAGWYYLSQRNAGSASAGVPSAPSFRYV